MSDGVNALMDPVQPPDADAMLHGPRPKPERAELLERHDPVLGTRERGQLLLDAFSLHVKA